MPRVLTRTVRLLKFGAVAGALVGVGRLVMQRRRRSQVDESSWPTIAETAAQNGAAVDSHAEDTDSPEPSDDADDTSDDTEDKA